MKQLFYTEVEIEELNSATSWAQSVATVGVGIFVILT
ncbi:hypothetical protein ICY_05123 [Bacillus cereus BAG2X1-3]|nr:hypothetical protein ICU_04916 [Bacillus cereus BAG2X1-1]EJS65130.1 hypothetical protein ICY_05129 [Bacillus cereus BAG2X1-3]EJS65158.1 hypothetical protein ICY_05123 [Bacillus cereus BAG2X1-3]